jgi:hypothetical protein
MVTILKWIGIALLGMLVLMHAAMTSSLLRHMYHYDVPGSWIPESALPWLYLIPLLTFPGFLLLLRYAKPIERMACVVFLAVVSVSFALFLLWHLTGRLTAK